MFIGEYNYSIDSKNRLGLPVKFRKQLLSGAVVTRGLESCLFLFSQKEWKELASNISKMPISKAKNRAFGRLMLAGAMEVKVDKQGRISLPDYLKKYADLKKKVVVAGVYDRLEIWDENKWKKYKQESEKDSSEIAEALEGLGV
jgi:MraZ protein